MILYEIRKIFARTGGRIALGLLLCTLAVSCFLAAHVYYVNGDGVKE